MTGTAFTAVIVSLSVLALAAQPAGSGALSGQVIDAVSGKPIANAAVTCDAGASVGVAVTDSQGHFRLDGLPAAHFRLFGSKPGYTGGAFGTDRPTQPGTWITLGAGEHRSGLTVRLVREGVLSGIVVDTDGEPIPHVPIAVMREVYSRGKWQVRMMMGSATEPDGRFRIARLAPGRYLLRACPRPVPGASSVHRSLFYPNASDAADAKRIDVNGGEVAGLELRLPSEPAVTLTGQIHGLPPAVENISILAMPAEEKSSFGFSIAAGSISRASDVATYTLSGLMPGRYIVTATGGQLQRPSMIAKQGVTIDSGDGQRLDLTLRPLLELSGSVTVAGPDAEKFRRFQVKLTPPEQGQLGGAATQVNPETLEFKLAGINPGIWDINVTPVPPGGYIHSMTLGDQDVLNEEMSLDSTTTAALKIVLHTQGASIEGQVEGKKPAILILAPTGKYANVPSYYQSIWTEPEGRFRRNGLTPGTYNLFAFDDVDFAVAQSPEFLARFAKHAVPVELTAGSCAVTQVSRIETLARDGQETKQ